MTRETGSVNEPPIRLGTPQDEDAVGVIRRACGISSMGPGQPTVRLVAPESPTGAVAGAAEYYRVFPPQDAQGWIGVQPGSRRKGLGAQLLRKLAGYAARHGIRNLALFIARDNQAAWKLLDHVGIPLRVHAAQDGFYVELDIVEFEDVERHPPEQVPSSAPPIASTLTERSPSLQDLTAPFALQPLGIVMQPRPGDPFEVEGVLNPAAARGPDGDLYLFPRLVAQNNYSRIGLARVCFDRFGEPRSVERLGIALEPAEAYERRELGGGGCEDARVTFVSAWGCFVMTYTAFSPTGPRIALAASHDLRRWERLGLVTFDGTEPMDFNAVHNKDAVLFPEVVVDPRTGRPSIALMHRPLVPGHSRQTSVRPEDAGEGLRHVDPQQELSRARARSNHQSIWLSYAPDMGSSPSAPCFRSHHRLMSPHASWERLKIGAGAPPLLTPLGWFVIYHGVYGHEAPPRRLRYSAGAVVLDPDCPEEIRFRTEHPILGPHSPHSARAGIIFPTGIDQRLDIDRPDRIDVYYGIGDMQIGVATLTLPSTLPQSHVDSNRRLDGELAGSASSNA